MHAHQSVQLCANTTSKYCARHDTLREKSESAHAQRLHAFGRSRCFSLRAPENMSTESFMLKSG